MKNYYDNPTLNEIANERRWGRVFGEATMLQMMAEAGDMNNPADRQEFIAEIEANF